LAIVFDYANVPVFSEKPISASRGDFKFLEPIKVPSQVDYQEIKSPVYRAISDQILESGFRPKEGIHVRSMWDPLGKPVLLTESGHDVSEILYLRKKMGLERKPVVDVMKFDNEVPERYAEIKLTFPDATFDVITSHLLDIVGTESAIRYFAWYDGSTCYLGSTLERKYADLFAVKFENGKKAFDELKGRLFFDRELIRIFVEEHNGEYLDTQIFGTNPAGEMLQEFVDGHPSIPIPSAIEIESPLYDAYDSQNRQPKWNLKGSLMDIRQKSHTQV
jgi:hypothetical protein